MDKHSVNMSIESSLFASHHLALKVSGDHQGRLHVGQQSVASIPLRPSFRTRFDEKEDSTFEVG